MRSIRPAPRAVARRHVLTAAAGLASGLAMPPVIRAQQRPVRLGVLTDVSSWDKANPGPGSVQAARLAVAEMAGWSMGDRWRSSQATTR